MKLNNLIAVAKKNDNSEPCILPVDFSDHGDVSDVVVTVYILPMLDELALERLTYDAPADISLAFQKFAQDSFEAVNKKTSTPNISDYYPTIRDQFKATIYLNAAHISNWSGIQDDDGNEIPYSYEIAVQICGGEDRKFLAWVGEHSQRIANEKEEKAKVVNTTKKKSKTG